MGKSHPGVDARRRHAADERPHAGPPRCGGDDVLAEPVHERLGLRVLGRGLRDHDQHGCIAGRAHPGRGHEGDVAGPLDGGCQAAHHGLLRGARELHRQHQRAVAAGPEPLGEQVVGLAGGEVGRCVAVVGEGQVHGEQRQRQSDEDDERHSPSDGQAPAQARPRVAHGPEGLDPGGRPPANGDQEHQAVEGEAHPQPDGDGGALLDVPGPRKGVGGRLDHDVQEDDPQGQLDRGSGRSAADARLVQG